MIFIEILTRYVGIDDVHDGLSGPLNLTFHPIVQLDEGSEYRYSSDAMMIYENQDQINFH